MRHSKATSILLAILIAQAAPAQQAFRDETHTSDRTINRNLPAYSPTRTEILERYRHAAILDSTANKKIYRSTLYANWQAGEKSFWYTNHLKDSTVEYIYVDVTKKTKAKAFDHGRLALAAGKAAGEKYDASRLRIFNMFFEDNAKRIRFQLNGRWWLCDLTNYAINQCTPPENFGESQHPGFTRRYRRFGNGDPNNLGPLRRKAWADGSDSISPDKRWAAVIKDGNLFVKSVANGDEIQMTNDGTTEKPYGYASWSPDNNTLVVYLVSPAEEKQVHYVLSSSSGTRGELKSRNYAQPGDDNTKYEMFIFNLADRKKIKADVDIIDFSGPPAINWRATDSRFFTFEKVDRGHQRFRIIEVSATSGKARELVDEKTNTFIFEQQIFTHYLPATNEIVWITEKDGWRHIYLLDALTGKEKLQVTKGEWVVREIDSIDIRKRQIWFRASGMDPNQDPYFVHYFRIGMDGKGLIKLTDGNANHRASFSPDRNYFIDSYSRVDFPTVFELRRSIDGRKIMDLEKADISDYLSTGLRLPEVFVCKGRDGATDIWGVVFRPSNFDSTETYPVIEQIYAGPQGSFVPKTFAGYNEMQSLAELGFIVVQIDGMGTYNRSKAFHDVCWKNIADAGFPDRILWIKSLASKYQYIDTTRIGVYGTSAGGQNATGALLFYPGFYDAAVSACGCHDNRIDKQWWNEQWMGYPVGVHYEKQSNITNAANLQGSLLLIVGEADENVPPESTYRMADALIKAGKEFELLVVPGMGHSDGGVYGRRKKRDFFVRQLLNVEPPRRNSGEL